jgi:hypothetical protein
VKPTTRCSHCTTWKPYASRRLGSHKLCRNYPNNIKYLIWMYLVMWRVITAVKSRKRLCILRPFLSNRSCHSSVFVSNRSGSLAVPPIRCPFIYHSTCQSIPQSCISLHHAFILPNPQGQPRRPSPTLSCSPRATRNKAIATCYRYVIFLYSCLTHSNNPHRICR